MKTRHSEEIVKILHSGTTFTGCEKFPPGVLPTKRQVSERHLHFRNSRTADAANDVANAIYDRWLWCNVYPLHRLTILKKLQSLVAAFSKLDRWLKKNVAVLFWKKKQNSYQMLTSCLIFLRQYCTAKTFGERA